MIADFLVRKKVIISEEKEIYQYGYEALFFCMEETILLLAIGMMFHKLVQTMLFIVVFATLRQHTGGYHAKSRVGCSMVTIGNLLINILFVQWLLQYPVREELLLGLVVLYVGVCLKYASVRDLTIVYLITAVLALPWMPEISWGILATMAEVALLIIVIPKRREKDEASI